MECAVDEACVVDDPIIYVTVRCVHHKITLIALIDPMHLVTLCGLGNDKVILCMFKSIKVRQEHNLVALCEHRRNVKIVYSMTTTWVQ